MNSKYKNLVKDTIIFAIGSFGSKIVLFFLVPLYTSFLSAEEYGAAELVFTVAQLLIPVVSLVIFDAVLRFGLKESECKEEVLLCGIVVMVVGSIVTVAITPAFGLYKAIAPWRWYLCAYVISSMATSIGFSYLKVANKNKTYAMLSVIQTLAVACLNILLLVVFKVGIAGYLLSNILAQTLTWFLIIFYGNFIVAIQKIKLNKSLLKRMICYSSPLIINNISWWIIHSSDKIMLDFMIGATALGLYTVSTKIPSLINMIISIFSQAWGLSAVREMEGSNDTDFYLNVFHLYSFVCFAACILLNTFIKLFMSIYVGKSFFDAWHYVPLLLTAAVFSAISSYFGTMYSALQKSINNMWTTLWAAIVNVVINYILIKKIGIMGAVVGTVVAYIVLAHIRMIDVLKNISIPINMYKYLLSVAIVIAQAVLVGLDLYAYLVSTVSLILFCVIYASTIQRIYKKTLEGVRRLRR